MARTSEGAAVASVEAAALEEQGGGRRWRCGCGSAGVLLGPLYRRSRSVERAVVAGWPARLVMRLLGGVNGVGRALPEGSCRRGGAALTRRACGSTASTRTTASLLLRRRRR